ncbi:hypothetical protein [Psychrobacillus sp. OK032]|nr:hypothetical protein [Psychrobacillus sp. OK032]
MIEIIEHVKVGGDKKPGKGKNKEYEKTRAAEIPFSAAFFVFEF